MMRTLKISTYLSAEIQNNTTNQQWVDWYQKFGEEVGQLRNSKLSVADRNTFLKGVLDRIIVVENDMQEQTLTLRFKQPFFNDRLIWKDAKNKKLGYTIRNGKKMAKVSIQSSKTVKKGQNRR